MTTITIRRDVLAALAVALVALGAGSALLIRGRRDVQGVPSAPAVLSPPASAPAAPAPAASTAAPLPDVTITLSAEGAQRAGIEVATVSTTSDSGVLRIPSVVQANAYRTVSVTPLSGGRITRVVPELGQEVRRGQLLAEIYSPDLAEARTQYVAARAELEAHELALQRTEKLVAIGAASRQELERIHAEHAAALALLESDRSRLTLLGLSAGEISALSAGSSADATLRITAPSDGIVTARDANAGLNVEPSTVLFTIADLSTVWVVGDLFERDFASVKLGDAVRVAFPAYPDLELTGTVSYIDPQLKPETRTAQLRVEAPNRDGRLRIGMLATMQLSASGGASTVVVPRTAVQTVGSRSVVYLVNATDATKFIEREVVLGDVVGDRVRVASGVAPGDVVVAKGSFALRAEAERLGRRAPASSAITRHNDPVARLEANPRPTLQDPLMPPSARGDTGGSGTRTTTKG